MITGPGRGAAPPLNQLIIPSQRNQLGIKSQSAGSKRSLRASSQTPTADLDTIRAE